MSRKPRFSLAGIPQHIVQRGHNQEPCFFGEADYLCYLDNLAQAALANRCEVHAYCLMTNHVHLLVSPGTEFGISHMMQDIGRKYVRYINGKYQRRGTLWEGRFKASLVDSDAYLLTCMRYIEQNPVRACMVEHMREYRWSSYACNAYGRKSPLICPHPRYVQLGDEQSERCRVYRALFDVQIKESELHTIRDMLARELVLGRACFREKVHAETGRQVIKGKPGRPPGKL